MISTGNFLEFKLWIADDYFAHIIVGKAMNNYFLCFPNLDTGFYFSDPDDICFSAYFDGITAYFVHTIVSHAVSLINILYGNNKYSAENNNSCSCELLDEEEIQDIDF